MMELLVVYRQPSDYPESYVLRRHVVLNDGTVWSDNDLLAKAPVSMGDTALESVRLPARSSGLVCMPRHPDDDPCIFEVWL